MSANRLTRPNATTVRHGDHDCAALMGKSSEVCANRISSRPCGRRDDDDLSESPASQQSVERWCTMGTLLELLPPGSAVAADGTLTIAGCRADELAEKFGTPVMIVDEPALRRRVRL